MCVGLGHNGVDETAPVGVWPVSVGSTPFLGEQVPQVLGRQPVRVVGVEGSLQDVLKEYVVPQLRPCGCQERDLSVHCVGFPVQHGCDDLAC